MRYTFFYDTKFIDIRVVPFLKFFLHAFKPVVFVDIDLEVHARWVPVVCRVCQVDFGVFLHLSVGRWSHLQHR